MIDDQDANFEDALLKWDSRDGLALMLGYRMAGDSLVDRALEFREQDLLVYPILFLYRHQLELSLKAVIEIAKKSLRYREKINHDLRAPDIVDELHPRRYGHNLAKAWADLAILLRPLAVDLGAEDISHTHAIVSRFIELDRYGDAFRYADSNVEVGVHKLWRLSLRQLRLVVGQASAALTGLYDWLDNDVQLSVDYLRWQSESLVFPRP